MTGPQRLRRLLTGLALVGAAGLGYVVWLTYTRLAVPCLFHALTGLLCPGCGVTRMCLALLRLDLAGAWQANPVLLLLLPVILGLLGCHMARYVRLGNVPTPRWENVAWSVLVGVLLLWGVVRNVL